jgi:hypothetical protein
MSRWNHEPGSKFTPRWKRLGLAVYRYSIFNMKMLQSFKCGDTEALHQRRRVARWVHIEAVARRKLDQLDAASELRDLTSPPGWKP